MMTMMMMMMTLMMMMMISYNMSNKSCIFYFILSY